MTEPIQAENATTPRASNELGTRAAESFGAAVSQPAPALRILRRGKLMRAAIAVVLVVAYGMTGFAQTPGALHASVDRQAAAILGTAQSEPQPSSPNAAPGQQRSWVARHRILTGTLIGLGVGVPIGIATCHYPTAEGSSCSDYTFPGNARMLGAVTIGAYGAAIGAGIGALVAAVTR